MNIKGAKISKKTVVRFVLIIALSIVLSVIYRYFMETRFFAVVFWCYAALTAAFALGYVIYNRGMSRKGVTRDMLPDTMSEDEKTEFIADGERRLERSKWMLCFIFAFVVVYAIDIFDLFVIPMIEGMFK